MSISRAEYLMMKARLDAARKPKDGNNQTDALGLCSGQPEPGAGLPLEPVAPRKAKSNAGSQSRFEITFRVYSQRPQDYDNIFTKQVQDCCVIAGLLPDDNWRVLQGRVISCKANKKEEERTEIDIVQLA